MGDNMNIANVLSMYPDGVEKNRNATNKGKTLNRTRKDKAMALLERGVKIVRICELLDIDKGTVKNWQESTERY